MVQAVISDLGRVIIFFDNRIFFKEMANFCPFTEEEIHKMTFGELSLVEAFDKGEVTPQEFYKRVIRKLQVTIDYDAFYSIYNNIFSLNPSVLEVIKKLKGHYKLILLSNTDVMRFGFIKKKFPEVMIFDEYVLSFKVGSMKPQSYIYRVALEKAGAKAEECIFIDDREENVETAEKLGIRGIIYKPQMDLESILKGRGLSF